MALLSALASSDIHMSVCMSSYMRGELFTNESAKLHFSLELILFIEIFPQSLDKTLLLYLCAMVRAGIVHVHDQV